MSFFDNLKGIFNQNKEETPTEEFKVNIVTPDTTGSVPFDNKDMVSRLKVATELIKENNFYRILVIIVTVCLFLTALTGGWFQKIFFCVGFACGFFAVYKLTMKINYLQQKYG